MLAGYGDAAAPRLRAMVAAVGPAPHSLACRAGGEKEEEDEEGEGKVG